MKYIFITGGVVSSLGKGLTAASLGALLEAHGYKICMQKFDPYLNVDPGTMSPFQHGEVYVLDDGAETDLDLGHYERFTSAKLMRKHSVSSGQIYSTVIQKERHGDYLGKTVQVIPHITDEIKKQFKQCLNDCDIVITEIGGTIGDIESLPFCEAMRQMALEEGRQNVLFVHITLIPYLRAAGELKTKPSQQSVAKLREIGIQPDILVCRTEKPLDEDIRKKLGMFCNVELKSVIEEQDLSMSIYELPIELHKENCDTIVLEKLGLQDTPCDISRWEDIIYRLKNPQKTVKIAVVGKYIDLNDAYKSVFESLVHAGIAHNCKIDIKKIDSEEIELVGAEKFLSDVNGILVPGGFGVRGVEGKIAAAKFARENDIPYLGICLGMQVAVIEFARNVANITGATSEEFDKNAKDKVVCLMESQNAVSEKGGTMRLGAYDCELVFGSKSAIAYGVSAISERHRHRYEFNSIYEPKLSECGMRVTGRNPKTGLAEIIEIPSNKWFVASQFHPEFKSKPTHAHPLFSGFVKAAAENC